MKISIKLIIFIQIVLLVLLVNDGLYAIASTTEYSFAEVRTNYVLDLTANGTQVTHKESGNTTLVPYGEEMYFDESLKYSKDTSFILKNVRSHAETYISWGYSSTLNVDFLRTGGYHTWGNLTPHEAMEKRFEAPYQYPDRSKAVIVSYINTVEYEGLEGISHAFDPSWDLDFDGLIDDDVTDLPEYVDINVRNENWNAYVAKYWTESWYSIIEDQIDFIAAQHFDGIMLDVVNGYIDHIGYELRNNPDGEWMDFYDIYKPLTDDLLTHIYTYSKEQYGTAFMVTGNLGWKDLAFYHDLGIMDAGYEQSAVFGGWGDGIPNGDGISDYTNRYENEGRDLLVERGLQPLDMEHLGKGVDNPYDWAIYDDETTQRMSNFLYLFNWSIESGSTPYICPVIWNSYPYGIISDDDTLEAMLDQSLRPKRFPRFTRIIENLPPYTESVFNDWVVGSDTDDTFTTGIGDDLVYTGPGNDEVDLGKGTDGAYYLEPKENYKVEVFETEVVLTHIDSNETDKFTNLEYIIFEDQIVTDLQYDPPSYLLVIFGAGIAIALTGIALYIEKPSS